MIRSQVPKSKVLSFYSSESLQTDSKNHVKALDKQFCTLSTPEVKKPLVSSNKSNLERSDKSIGLVRRMVHFVTLRKKQRNFRGGVFPKKPLGEQFLAKGNMLNAKPHNEETCVVSQAVLRKITEIDLEKSRTEEDFVSMIHDLVMLSEMTTEGTDEKFALLKEIEALRTEYRSSQLDLEDISDFVKTQQQRDQCFPLTNDTRSLTLFPTAGGIPVHKDNLHFNFSQNPKFTVTKIVSNETRHDLACKNQKSINADCESMPSERVIVDSDTLNLANFEESNSQVESNEFEELRNIIVLLIAQRDALRADFEGFYAMVSDLVYNTEGQVVADQKLSTLEDSKEALFREQKNLLHDIKNEWKDQRKILESTIESQTQIMVLAHSELMDMKRESEASKERATVLSNELNVLSRRYQENLNSIKVMQRKIQEEEARSASLLLVKDFEHENMREVYDAELVKMKNEISVISLENILFSSKIAEASADLLCSEKTTNELNVNELLSLIDQLRTKNDAILTEVGKLSDFSTSYQRSALSEKMELLHELNKARSTIFLLQTENTSLSLERNEFCDKSDQSDMQEEIAMLQDLMEKIEAENEELRRNYLALFEQVVVFNAQNTCQIGILMEETSSHGKETIEI
jgi:hypothetical protein